MENIGLRIIIIDDNPAIHQNFINVLTMRQQVTIANNVTNQPSADLAADNAAPVFQFDTSIDAETGLTKIKQARANGNPYALAFVDNLIPPDWDGIKTINDIWAIDPELQVVICMPDCDYSWEDTVKNLGITDNLLILKKPFDNTSVQQLAYVLTRKWLLAKDVKHHTEVLNKAVQARNESLQQALLLLRATIESSASGILVLNLEHQVVDYNQLFINVWGLSPTLVIDNHRNSLITHLVEQLENPHDFLEKITYLSQHLYESSTQIIRLKNQKILECYSHPHLINTVAIGRVWSFHDVTQQFYIQERSQYQATHDELTNLPNRLLLNDRIQQAMNHASRHKKQFAILFLDIDHFKLVNDSLSHEAGDQLLLAVTTRLLSVVRQNDTLARLGGDEFVIIISELSKNDDIISVGQKILGAFEQPFQLGQHKLSVATSIGISVYPTDGTTINQLLRNADLAMYQSKAQGGNQFRFYTHELNQQSQERFAKENELRQAITNKEFFLVYQPQARMIANQQVLVVEALLRWSHPQKGILLPRDFMPLAEKSGLIVFIGEWVIRDVCQQMRRWHDNGLPDLRVAINVACQQLKQQNFALMVHRILQDYQINPEFIELEITESVLMSHVEIMRIIQQLKDMGITIVLDDFGANNLNLDYLKDMHIDRLKIGQSFMKNLTLSRSNEIIIEAIMIMARNLKFQVVAGGVETEKQHDFLKTQSCNDIQGYFFSKPLSATLIEEFFKKNQ